MDWPDGEPHRVEDQRNGEDRRADASIDATEGLSSEQARTRLERYGPNELKEGQPSVLLELLSHFWAPIPWMIEVALVLTALTERWADFGIILALLLLNGVVGFWEEHQAQNAIEALADRLAKRARVRRGGAWMTVGAEELVPGDLIAIERGDIIPADGVVLVGGGYADESALTGESLPVTKRTGDEAYSGTVLTRGSPRVRVLATGAHTMFGRTAELTRRERPQSHSQRAILRIARYLIAIAISLVGVIVAVSLMRGTDVTMTLEFALVVTIASVPVALPAVLSVTMAVGARELARQQAVVSHLPAVEEMTGVDVLCADKTGTITRNELAIVEVIPLAAGVDRGEVLLAAALTAEPDGQDPVDRAIAAALGRPPDGFEVLDLDAFDADKKRAEVLVRDRRGFEYRAAKGAVQAILDLAGADAPQARKVPGITAGFAAKGYRTLAVARAEGSDWRLLGLLAIEDPPRKDSRSTLEQASGLGVAVKMVTGDRVEIARQIAGEVGLGQRIAESSEIEILEGEEFADRVEAADGFAEAVPEDKYRIVEALQSRGHIVGMTGDGVNDAPALYRADAGIAVSGATDAARAAADIVLLSTGLSVIVEAIHRAREVFRRMTNYAIYRITETIRVVLLVTIAIVVFDFFPVTPIQIVLLAILNDAAILTIAYDRVLPSPTPQRWALREVLSIATLLGLVGVVSSFLLAWIGHVPLDLTDDELRTLLYLKLSVAGHLTLFVARTRGRFWSHRPASVVLIAVIGTQIIATVIAAAGFLMEPLGWGLIALAWAYALAWMLVLDQMKVTAYRVLERSE
ncbi:MAG: plasma-membrane proton-efflux P-type ATPase [Thermoleophilia bacterium]|nr:plasma-membrane proton-efflux P-type ATPase [Thermoleophilia bacterium]